MFLVFSIKQCRIVGTSIGINKYIIIKYTKYLLTKNLKEFKFGILKNDLIGRLSKM